METSVETNRPLPNEPLLKSKGEVDWQNTYHTVLVKKKKKTFETARENNLVCADSPLVISNQ